MKNNYFLSKNYKKGFVAFLMLFFGLISIEATAQTAVAANDTFVWTGTQSSDWATPANWTILRGTTSPGTNTYPGELGTVDVVFINKSDTPYPLILDGGQVFDVIRLNVTNAFGGEVGPTFTIANGATLNVGNATTSNHVNLNGGNIVNNGTLNIIAIGVGFTGFPVYGFNCGTPTVLPTIPREYGYSGTGTLRIDLATANFAGAAAIAVTGNSGSTVTPTNSANVTYKFLLNNPDFTLNQASVATIHAIRAAGGNNANKLIIGGTGLTMGTTGTPSIGALIALNGGASITIESGTSLTFNSVITNTNSIIGGFSTSTFAANLFNNGTITIQGASARSGLNFGTGSKDIASVFNINNLGTLNVNLNIPSGGYAALSIGNGGGGAANAGSVVNVTNTGTMTLKNTATAVGTGFPIFCVTASEAARMVITNSGILNMEGSTYALGLKTILDNNGILNSNSELRGFTAINNNAGGSINFVRNAATATTKQVSFTITLETDTSGSIGSIYKDESNNEYAIVVQKYSGGVNLVANVVSGATIPLTGTLTRTTGTGAATIAYTAVGISAVNIAATGTVTNSGTINTDTASNLNILSLVASTATSILSPGGDTGKGILTIPELPSGASDLLTLGGTLKMQISGNTAAGVDYDMMQVTGLLDVIDISGATLDVTGIYTPTAATTLDLISTNTTTDFAGAVAGNFASVVGLKSGWSVGYIGGLGGKVQLVYDPNDLGTTQFANASFRYGPNPATNELNLSAEKNISKVEFFNILGQRVQSNTVNANQKQVDMSGLQNGMYLMEVTIDSAKKAFKIMKQ